jgi:tRNA uridine 5-carboxymethylaminomethyl modification enzyme
MFTSRAEYRLMLREDNADLRLTPKGRELGLVDDERWAYFEQKQEQVEQELQRLRSTLIRPADLSGDQAEALLGGPLSREQRLDELLKRPGVNYTELMTVETAGPGLDDEAVAEQVEIQIKYAGYIDRQNTEIEKTRRHEETRLPEDLDYTQIKGLSAEVCEKLTRQRPVSIGQASRIPGVTPAAISILLVHLKKKAFKESA